MKGKKENKKGSFLLHVLFVCITPRQWQRGLINEAQNKSFIFEGKEMILKACQLQFNKSYDEQTVPALSSALQGQFTSQWRGLMHPGPRSKMKLITVRINGCIRI